ncbi:PspA/IM30 family protein [Endothiovibrio diazotrophicus]
MSVLKRITATLHARVERVANQLENHDAVVEAALRDGRQALACSKVRLGRVRHDGERLAAALEEARGNEAQWSARARACADDEAQALECLRRRRAQGKRAEELERAVADHRERAGRLAAEVAAAERRLTAFADRRNLMRGRESAAAALGTLNGSEPGVTAELEETLERWEVRLTEAELALEPGDGAGNAPGGVTDPLERRFLDEEERASLLAELHALSDDRKED